MSPEVVQVAYQICVQGRADLDLAPDEATGFAMTLLRLLAFRPGAAGAAKPPVASGVAPAAAKSGGGSQTHATTAAVAATAAAPLAGDASWPERMAALGLDGFAKQLARHCAWIARDGAVVRLALDPKVKHLLQEDRRAAIEQALSRQLGETLRVQIELAQAPAATPARLDEQREADRLRAAESAIETDPMVRALKEKLGATVRAGSVQPVDRNNGAGK